MKMMEEQILAQQEEQKAIEVLKGRDVVVIGLQPWYYEIGSNCKNIATELAKYNRVLYVNLPVNRKTFHAKDNKEGIANHIRIIKNGGETIRSIAQNFWEFYPTSVVESINWLPSTAMFKWVNAINNRRFANDLKKAIKQLGFQNIVLFNDNDFFNGYGLKELLHPHIYIYYCRDYLRGYDYWKKHGDIIEPELISKADVTLSNSLYLTDYCLSFNKHSHYMGQGCNLELFDHKKNYEVPENIKGISSPIIGYVGAVIADRLDIRIIEIIAHHNPQWQVVLVGPEDDTFKSSSLHHLPNVHFLGRKPLEQLSSYVAAFDVCINPQLINPITIGNYPLKVDEYLAMGKPVVASATKTMELFLDHTYQATKPEEYPALIKQALAEDNAERRAERIAFAHSHTWENCMKALYLALQKEKLVS
jgi:teichuronic acid biosynthesis glycosyltransferase TuaH